MRNKTASVMRRTLAAVVLIAVLAAAALSAGAQDNEQLIDGIICREAAKNNAATAQEWLDGALAAGAGQTSEWFVLALRQYRPELDFSAYAAALEARLRDGNISGAVARQRCALLLVACGRADSPAVADVAAQTAGAQGIMSWIFALHLANNGIAGEHSAEDIKEKLLSLRLADGGWALGGERSDVDVTAMTIQTLAPYYDSDPAVRDAVDGALDLLGSMQLENGGYKSYGTENPESIAQVITALASVGIDPAADARFEKNGADLTDALLRFRLEDGSFCHTEAGESNATSTAQALYSLVALYRLRAGLGPLYLFGNDDTASSDTYPETGLQTDATPGTSEPQTESSAPQPDNRKAPGYKLWASLFILAAALAACIILAVSGKRNYKNFLFVAVIAALLLCVVLLTDIRSADSYYGTDAQERSDIAGTVTLTIRCDSAVGKVSSEHIPADGVVLEAAGFTFCEGDTVYDLLIAAARKYGIHVESNGMRYIEGISYLYEYDCGDLSGWMYRVNGEIPSVGCGEYRLRDGDCVEWLYTCELGNDLN